MNRAVMDFRTLSCNILNETLQGIGGDLYALGNSKILMMNEIVAVLERAKVKAVRFYLNSSKLERKKR